MDTLAIAEQLKVPLENMEITTQTTGSGVRNSVNLEQEIWDALQEDPDAQEYLQYL